VLEGSCGKQSKSESKEEAVADGASSSPRAGRSAETGGVRRRRRGPVHSVSSTQASHQAK